MSFVPRSALPWCVSAGSLVLVLCSLASSRPVPGEERTTRSAAFVGARVRCADAKSLFAPGLRPATVPFASTDFERGGFTLTNGALEIPADGVYFVEAGVSVRFPGPHGQVLESVRMKIRAAASVVAAATGPRVADSSERTTCVSASTICPLRKGDKVLVELSAEAIGDDAGNCPAVAGENANEVCHLSIARLDAGAADGR